jgi:hypothetical protein
MFNEEDDLTADLLGDGATDEETKELAAAQEAAKKNPLIVPPPNANASRAKRAEKKANDAAVKRGTAVTGYEVTVEGLYLAPAGSPGKRVKKPYSMKAVVASLEGALSAIKNKLLDKKLKMAYPDYLTFLTHNIANVRALSADCLPSNNIAYMDEPTLKDHIRLHKVPVDVKDYEGDLVALRAAVVDFTLNPKGFKERETARRKDALETLELGRLNNL